VIPSELLCVCVRAGRVPGRLEQVVLGEAWIREAGAALRPNSKPSQRFGGYGCK
jgi:hypothetical protein